MDGFELNDLLVRAKRWGMLNGVKGSSFAITGTLSVPRTAMAMVIQSLGGGYTSSVLRGTGWLIVPDMEYVSTGSNKVRQATLYGTSIITEAMFCRMILPTVEELRS